MTGFYVDILDVSWSLEIVHLEPTTRLHPEQRSENDGTSLPFIQDRVPDRVWLRRMQPSFVTSGNKEKIWDPKGNQTHDLTHTGWSCTQGSYHFSQKNFPVLFHGFSRTQIDFSRTPKFTLTLSLPKSQCYFCLLSFNTSDPVYRVRTGPGKPGKSWNFIVALSRTGKT